MSKKVLGIVVGGGPAPGINSVISAAVIEARKAGFKCLGILDGFKWLIEGDIRKVVNLEINDVSWIHTVGGSILRTSRAYPSKEDGKFDTLIRSLKLLGITHLITIGGDGTSNVARMIHRAVGDQISVVHVPKTIDNDIPLPSGMVTFGYETARAVGVNIISNIMQDAKTTNRWYIVVVMGRHAGHLALGIGKSSGATLTIIPEEFKVNGKKISLEKVAKIILGSIVKRIANEKEYGVCLLAEGLAEIIDWENIREELHGLIERDEMGRIRLSGLPLGLLVKEELKRLLKEYNINLTIVNKDIGYELRCANPIPFDIDYTRTLGYGAVKYLLAGGSGGLVTLEDGKLNVISLEKLLDKKTKRTKVRMVDVDSESYKVGREYMIRLEKQDLEDEKMLMDLSDVINVSPERFISIFKDVVEG